MIYGFIFHKKVVPECKPEWNREAITVFSRLSSLVVSTASHMTYYNLPKLVIQILFCEMLLNQGVAMGIKEVYNSINEGAKDR